MRRRLAVGLPALALALLWIGVRITVELRPVPSLGPETRTAVIRALREALEGRPVELPAAPELHRANVGPLWVTLYADGAPRLRRECRGADLSEAVAACARELTNHPQRAELARGSRIKVDITTAEGPLWTIPKAALALGVVPGVDGVGLRFGAQEVRLLPDDLIREDLFGATRPFDFIPELRIGLHPTRLVNLLARRVGASRSAWARTPKRFFRFRTDAFIEPVTERAAPRVVRGDLVTSFALDEGTLQAAAEAAGQYAVKAQRPDGRFNYIYETLHDTAFTSGYSLPRHFGTASFLSQLSGANGSPVARGAAQRAIALIETIVPAACNRPDRACVALPGEQTADTGSTALALVALLDYRHVSGDHTQDPLARRLAQFLLAMQRPRGDFAHIFWLATGRPDPDTKLLYYDGEASLALVRAYEELKDPRYLEGARRALDYLTKEAYSHFAGRFYFGEEHWTCIAAQAAWPHLRDPAYDRFCTEYGAFLRLQQFAEDEHPPDFAGSYGFTPFFPPHTTPAASRTEAMISAFLLSQHHGHADERLRRQCLAALRYLLQHQLRADTCYLCRDPARAHGGFLQNPVSRHIRIDFVQHAGLALLRGRAVVHSPSQGPRL